MPDEFAERVRGFLLDVPAGALTTYGDVARAAGSPMAARRVVWTLRTLGDVPWWRVVNGRGSISPHEGMELQARLLRAEGVAVGEDYTVPLQDLRWDGPGDCDATAQAAASSKP